MREEDKLDLTPEESSTQDFTWMDVAAERQFYAPAGFGLLVLVLAMLFGSPFKWVLLFAYFLIGVPLLAFYVRKRIPLTQDDDGGRIKDPEPEAGFRVRSALEHLSGSKNIDESQLLSAIAQYKELEAVRQVIRKRLFEAESLLEDNESRDRGVAASDRIYQVILKNLHSCSILFAKLDAINLSSLVKHLQSARAGRDLDSHKELAAKREKMISQVLDRLQSGQKILGQYKKLAANGMPAEARMQQLRELAEKTNKQKDAN